MNMSCLPGYSNTFSSKVCAIFFFLLSRGDKYQQRDNKIVSIFLPKCITKCTFLAEDRGWQLHFKPKMINHRT